MLQQGEATGRFWRSKPFRSTCFHCESMHFPCSYTRRYIDPLRPLAPPAKKARPLALAEGRNGSRR